MSPFRPTFPWECIHPGRRGPQEGGALARGRRPRKRGPPSQEGAPPQEGCALARGGRPRKRGAGRSSCVCLTVRQRCLTVRQTQTGKNKKMACRPRRRGRSNTNPAACNQKKNISGNGTTPPDFRRIFAKTESERGSCLEGGGVSCAGSGVDRTSGSK